MSKPKSIEMPIEEIYEKDENLYQRIISYVETNEENALKIGFSKGGKIKIICRGGTICMIEDISIILQVFVLFNGIPGALPDAANLFSIIKEMIKNKPSKNFPIGKIKETDENVYNLIVEDSGIKPEEIKSVAVSQHADVWVTDTKEQVKLITNPVLICKVFVLFLEIPELFNFPSNNVFSQQVEDQKQMKEEYLGQGKISLGQIRDYLKEKMSEKYGEKFFRWVTVEKTKKMMKIAVTSNCFAKINISLQNCVDPYQKKELSEHQLKIILGRYEDTLILKSNEIIDRKRRSDIQRYHSQVRKSFSSSMSNLSLGNGFSVQQVLEDPGLNTVTLVIGRGEWKCKYKVKLDDFMDGCYSCEKYVKSETPVDRFLHPTELTEIYTPEQTAMKVCDSVMENFKKTRVKVQEYSRNKKDAPTTYMLDRIKEINDCCDEGWLYGFRKKIPQNVSIHINTKTGIVEFSSQAGVLKLYDEGTYRFDPSDLYNTYTEAKMPKLQKRCVEFAKEQFKGFLFSRDKDREEADGILYGNTALTVRYGGECFDFLYETPCWKDSVPEWKNTLLKNKKEIIRMVEEKRKSYLEMIRKKAEGYYCSILQQAVFDFVRKNEKYVTETAVIQALRGTKILLNTTIEYTPECGHFNALDASEISKAVNRLVNSGLLYEQTLKGTYGNFDILKIGTLYEKIQPDTIVYEPCLMKKFKQGKGMKEQETVCVFHEYTKKPSLEVSDYLDLVNGIEKYPVSAVYCMDELNGLFQNAPKEVTSFVKMKKDMEDKRLAKIYGALLKKSKKEA